MVIGIADKGIEFYHAIVPTQYYDSLLTDDAVSAKALLVDRNLAWDILLDLTSRKLRILCKNNFLSLCIYAKMALLHSPPFEEEPFFDIGFDNCK